MKPVEIETVVAAAPPYVEVEAAPEGVGSTADASLEANLTLDETVAWFASARTGRRFHRHGNNPSARAVSSGYAAVTPTRRASEVERDVVARSSSR